VAGEPVSSTTGSAPNLAAAEPGTTVPSRRSTTIRATGAAALTVALLAVTACGGQRAATSSGSDFFLPVGDADAGRQAFIDLVVFVSDPGSAGMSIHGRPLVRPVTAVVT